MSFNHLNSRSSALREWAVSLMRTSLEDPVRRASILRMASAVAVLAGGMVGLSSLLHNLEVLGVLILAPLVLFPYVLIYLLSERTILTPALAGLLVVSIGFVTLSLLTLTPSLDAQGGLIVVVVPALQSTIAFVAYVVLRLTRSLLEPSSRSSESDRNRN
jgi:hypothetical protein